MDHLDKKGYQRLTITVDYSVSLYVLRMEDEWCLPFLDGQCYLQEKCFYCFEPLAMRPVMNSWSLDPWGHRQFGQRPSIYFFCCLLIWVMVLLGAGNTSSIRGGLARWGCGMGWILCHGYYNVILECRNVQGSGFAFGIQDGVWFITDFLSVQACRFDHRATFEYHMFGGIQGGYGRVQVIANVGPCVVISEDLA